jgi:hypothetical protein
LRYAQVRRQQFGQPLLLDDGGVFMCGGEAQSRTPAGGGIRPDGKIKSMFPTDSTVQPCSGLHLATAFGRGWITEVDGSTDPSTSAFIGGFVEMRPIDVLCGDDRLFGDNDDVSTCICRFVARQ